jgi:hypothetical protein
VLNVEKWGELSVGQSGIKLGDVVFVYEMPPENSLLGVVRSIKHPMIRVETTKRDGSTKEHPSSVTLNLSDNIPLTVLDTQKQQQVLSTNELKRLGKLQNSETLDLFAGAEE